MEGQIHGESWYFWYDKMPATGSGQCECEFYRNFYISSTLEFLVACACGLRFAFISSFFLLSSLLAREETSKLI